MDINPVPTVSVPNMPKGSNAKFHIIIGILLLLLTLSLVFNVKNLYQLFNSAPNLRSSVSGTNNPLLTNLTATITGKITKVSGKNLTVQNFQGVIGEVTVSDNVLISKITPGVPFATPSSDLKQIELNKDVSIFLSLVNGNLVATSISFIPPLPPITSPKSVPLPATGSGAPKLSLPSGSSPLPVQKP